MEDHVYIFDTTLRDGEQSPGASLNSDEKLEIARQLARLGVDVIEAGFPIASPDDFDAVRRIARDLRGWWSAGWPAPCRTTSTGRGRPSQEAERPRIHAFMSTSDIHLVHQFHKSREEALADIDAMVGRAKGVCSDVEFSPMDASRTDPGVRLQGAGGRHRRGRHHGEHPGHRRLHHARGVRGADSRHLRQRAEYPAKPSSPSTATTTSAWPPPTASPP